MKNTLPRPAQALEAAATTTPHLRLVVAIDPAHPKGFMSQKAHEQYLVQRAALDKALAEKKAAFTGAPPLQQQKTTQQNFQALQMQQQQQAGALLPKTP